MYFAKIGVFLKNKEKLKEIEMVRGKIHVHRVSARAETEKRREESARGVNMKEEERRTEKRETENESVVASV